MKRISKIFFMVICIMIFIAVGSASADDYYTLDYYTDPTSISSAGGEVALTVKINHDMNSAYVMNDAKVYKGDVLVMSLGDIYAGQEVAKSGLLSVDSSEVTGVNMTLKYSESGTNDISKDFIVSFNTIDNIQPEVEFARNVSKTSGDSSESVTLEYTVKNTGNVHIENLVIHDDIFGDVRSLSVLKTGQNTVVEREIVIGEGFTSTPKITYNVGSQGYSETLDAVTVVSGSPEITMELMSNKSTAAIDELVEVSITVSNTGATGLDNVVISENTLGELFTIDGLAAGETATKTYQMTIAEGIDYIFTAVGDNGGELEWIAQQSLDVIVDIEAPPLLITFEALTPDVVMDKAGIANFDLGINNNSANSFVNVVIKDNMGNEIQTIPNLLPGPTKFQYKMNVEQSGNYFFTLTLTNSLGKEQSVNTTPVNIIISEVSTETGTTPAVNPTSTPQDNQNTGLLGDTRKLLMIGLAVIAALLLMIIAQVIARKRRGY